MTTEGHRIGGIDGLQVSIPLALLEMEFNLESYCRTNTRVRRYFAQFESFSHNNVAVAATRCETKKRPWVFPNTISLHVEFMASFTHLSSIIDTS